MKAARWLASVSLATMLAGCGLLDSTDKQRDRADAALASGQYGEAAIILRNLIDKVPEDPALWLALARTLFMQGEMEAAQTALETAGEHGADPLATTRTLAQWDLSVGNPQRVLDAVDDPQSKFDDYDRRYLRARALQGLRRMPEAVAIYQELLAERPRSADLQLRMAQAHAYLGRSELAHRTVDEALAAPTEGSEPIAAEAWLLKAVLFERSGDVANLRDAYRRAVEAAPGQLGALPQGQLLVAAFDQALRAGDIEQARSYSERLAQVLPQSPLARLVQGKVQLFSDEPAQGVSELQRLLQEFPDQREARLVLAGALLHIGSFEQALAEINTLAGATPGTSELTRLQELVRSTSPLPVASAERAINIASGLLLLRQPAVARRQLQQALPSHADDPALQRALVQVELRNGRGAEALRLATSLASQAPDEPVGQLVLAEAQVAAGEHAAAANTYQRMWSTAPRAPLALALAQARERAGHPQPVAPLQEWLQRQPRDSTVRLRLASALQQSGEKAAAIQQFQRLVAELPQGQLGRSIALNNLAILYSEVGDARALETARQAHAGAGEVPAIQDTYGWLLARNERLDEGLSLLRSAHVSAPESAGIRYHYGAALAMAGEDMLARLVLSDLLQHDGQFEGRDEATRLFENLRAVSP